MTSIFSSAQRGQIIFFSLFTVGQHSGQFFSPCFGFRQILHRLAVVAAKVRRNRGGGVDNQFVGNACRAGARSSSGPTCSATAPVSRRVNLRGERPHHLRQVERVDVFINHDHHLHISEAVGSGHRPQAHRAGKTAVAFLWR